MRSNNEPVRIRYKDLANGTKSIYLDTYKSGKRSYEFLKLYLLPEDDDKAKAVSKRLRIYTLHNSKKAVTAFF